MTARVCVGKGGPARVRTEERKGWAAETPYSLQRLERGVLLEGASDLNSLIIADFGAFAHKPGRNFVGSKGNPHRKSERG